MNDIGLNEYSVHLWGVPDWQREWYWATWFEEFYASSELVGYFLYWRWL